MGPGASELNVANSPFVAARDALAVTLRPRNLTEKARLNAGLVLTYRATAGGVRDRLVWAYQLPSCQQGGGGGFARGMTKSLRARRTKTV